MADLAGATSLALGEMHLCATRDQATVVCRGFNRHGQLGDGTDIDRAIAFPVDGLLPVSELAAGDWHTCASLLDDTIQCWGDNWAGALGGHDPHTSIPVIAATVSNAVQVAAGESHSCALDVIGQVECWGRNVSGQLGAGDTSDRLISTPVVGLNDARMIDAHYHSTCAARTNGSMACWGMSALAPGSIDVLPALQSGVVGVLSVATGSAHVCARHNDHSASCWGTSYAGQLIGPLSDVQALSAGSTQACVIDSHGTVRCWGDNSGWQLGNPGNPVMSLTPVVVLGVADAVSLGLGTRNSCAIVQDGRVRCWGSGYGGFNPVQIEGISDATQIDMGHSHGCARIADGSVKCWGGNEYGQLGSSVPIGSASGVTAERIENALGVTVGDSHSCAALENGLVKCWGRKGYGELGNGTRTDAWSPQRVVGTPFAAGTRLIAFANDGQLQDSSTAQFNVHVENNGDALPVKRSLKVAVSATLVDGGWTCQAAGGAVCPSIAPTAGAGSLDVSLVLPDGGSLRFQMTATIDAANGAFAEWTTRFLDASNPSQAPEITSTAIAIMPLGIFKGSFEAVSF